MNPDAVAYLIQKDEELARIIDQVDPPETESTQDVFHDLMSCVIEQQIHYRSSKKVFQKLLDTASITQLNRENFAHFEEKALSTQKLSGNKYQTILSLVEHWDELDQNWETLSDEEVRRQLSQLSGIGTWTIDMILIYTLQRPDVFAFDDYHIKQILVQLYGLNAQSRLKKQMQDLAQNWAPYRSTAFLYFLAWKEALKTGKK
jgi:DNA-3-methyladenine glycosylase II